MLAAPPIQGCELPEFSMVGCMSDTYGSMWCIFPLFLAFYLVRKGCGLLEGHWECKVLSSWPLKKISPPGKGQRWLSGLYEAAYIPSAPTGCLDKERSSFSITRHGDAMTYMNTEVPALFLLQEERWWWMWSSVCICFLNSPWKMLNWSTMLKSVLIPL